MCWKCNDKCRNFINTQLPFYERVVQVGICDKNSLISRKCTCVIPYQRTYENRNFFYKTNWHFRSKSIIWLVILIMYPGPQCILIWLKVETFLSQLNSGQNIVFPYLPSQYPITKSNSIKLDFIVFYIRQKTKLIKNTKNTCCSYLYLG